MKRYALFIFLCFIFTVSASFAEDGIVKGKFSLDEKLRPYSDAELDEAIGVSDDCKAVTYTNTRYDCDCLGMTFLKMRRKKGNEESSFWITEAAKKKCPNAPAMAGKIYSECLSWAPRQRGEDYQEFCSCYGSTFAKIFSKNPTEVIDVNEAQMTKAMMDCNVNSVNKQAQDRDSFVKKLKENNVYDLLFPGAKNETNVIE